MSILKIDLNFYEKIFLSNYQIQLPFLINTNLILISNTYLIETDNNQRVTI